MKPYRINKEVYEDLANQLYQMGEYPTSYFNNSMEYIPCVTLTNEGCDVTMTCDVTFYYTTASAPDGTWRELTGVNIHLISVEVRDENGIVHDTDFNVEEIERRLSA